MGSLFEVLAFGDAERVEAAARAAFERVRWVEGRLSHFVPTSDVRRMNAEAFAGAVEVESWLFELWIRLRELTAETEGAFDPTMGRLVRAWGFFRRGAIRGEPAAAPSAEEIDACVAGGGWRNVILDPERRTVRFLSPTVELHVGAVGKGFAVDCAARALRESGVESALVHSGYSSIAAIGAPPDEEGWPVGVGGETILLRDEALSVSGSEEQAVVIDGEEVSHIFDPRAGRPVARRGSVYVVTPEALTGDALSTAMFVNGPDWADAFSATRPEVSWLFEHAGARGRSGGARFGGGAG